MEEVRCSSSTEQSRKCWQDSMYSRDKCRLENTNIFLWHLVYSLLYNNYSPVQLFFEHDRPEQLACYLLVPLIFRIPSMKLLSCGSTLTGTILAVLRATMAFGPRRPSSNGGNNRVFKSQRESRQTLNLPIRNSPTRHLLQELTREQKECRKAKKKAKRRGKGRRSLEIKLEQMTSCNC